MSNSSAATDMPPMVSEATGFSRSYQQKAVLLLLSIYSFSYLDRYIMNILAESIKVDLQLEDWQVGLMTGLAFSVCYSFAGIPFARYADRGHRPKIITAAIAVWSAATVLSGAAQNFIHMLIARIFVGVGEAGCTPPAHSLISDYVPKKNRGFALATYSLALPIGSVLGLGLGGVIGDIFGWRWAFVIVGAPGVAFALGAYFFLREPRENAEVGAAAKAAVEPVFLVLGNLWKVPTFRWTAIGVAVMSIPMYAAAAFQASFFLRVHAGALNEWALAWNLGPLSLLGILLGAGTGLGAFVGTLLGGVAGDKLRLRGNGEGVFLVPVAAALIGGPLIALSFWVDSFTVAVLFNCLAFIFLGCWVGPVYATVHSVVPVSSRATSSAIILMAVNLVGMSVGPFIVGVFSDYLNYGIGLGLSEGLRWALVFICSVLFFAAIPMFWLASRKLKDDLVG